MASSLAGGLEKVHGALHLLEADPSRLERARMRFSASPPEYNSIPSGTTTRSESPNPISDEQRQKEERYYQVRHDRGQSLPYGQFLTQVDEEAKRIWESNPATKWMTQIPSGGLEEKEAIKIVRGRWIEQGIWKDKWEAMAAGNYRDIGRWKHEEPLEVESEFETDTEAEFIFLGPKPRRLKSEAERRQVAGRRVLRARDREASKPYHQFVYQVSKERERMCGESVTPGDAENVPVDINTQAYENVKSIWSKRGIWDSRWGILPGMSWKHEHPLEDFVEYTRPAQPVENGDDGEAEPANPPVFTFGLPSNVSESNGLPDVTDPSHYEPSAAASENGLENEHVEPSKPTPGPKNRGRRATRGKTTHIKGSRPDKTSGEDDQNQPASKLLGQGQKASKVAKSTPNSKGNPRKRTISQVETSETLAKPPADDTPQAQPGYVTPRKSPRLREKRKAEATSPNTNTQASKANSKRKTARTTKVKSSAKPQGVSKPTRNTRSKAKKK